MGTGESSAMDVAAKMMLKVLPGHDDLPAPAYMTAGAAGMDLAAAVSADLVLRPGERAAVPTGLAVAIPDGYEGQVRPRSGLAATHGVTCLNSPGTVDSDYRGELRVILINHGTEPFIVRRGYRIAQLVISPVARVQIQKVDELPETLRGIGGFGHTGGIGTRADHRGR